MQDIAYRLPEISQSYSAPKVAQDADQKSLDRLNALHAEKKMYLVTYGEKEAERRLALAEEEMAKRRIWEIESSLSELQRELCILRPQWEDAANKLAKAAEEQTCLYNQSKPLDQCIKELEAQKGVLVYDWERGQSDVQSAISSWDRLCTRLASLSAVVPAGESSVDTILPQLPFLLPTCQWAKRCPNLWRREES